MKSWEEMTLEERQERLGDPTIDRVDQTAEFEAGLLDLYLRGVRLSIADTKRARRIHRQVKHVAAN